ncbi:MAG: signal transduction histidine kinase [Hyphomicrobiales bacterium]|nr:signal transduction histidine kinase [Hyphomicrobiales bacterium]
MAIGIAERNSISSPLPAGVEPLLIALDSYRAALLTAPVPFMVVTVEGEIVLVNQAFTAATGFSVADLPHIRDALRKMRRISPEQIDVVLDGWRHAKGASQIGSTEISVWTQWNEMRTWVIHTSCPVIWMDGRSVLLQTAFDITEQRRLEDALRRSQDEMRVRLSELEALYSSAPLGLGMLDSNLKYVRINAALADIHGFGGADHIGRGVFDVLPDLRDTYEASLRHVLKTGEPVRDKKSRLERPASPGVVRDLVESFYPVRDAAGGTIGLGVICQDVTERNRAEDAAVRADAALRRTLDLLFLALRTAGVSVFAQDTSLRYAWLGGDLFGRHASEALGGADADVLPPDLVKPVTELKKQVLATGESAQADLPYVADGRTNWCNFRVEAWRDENGAVMGLLGAVADISKRKMSEQHVRTLMNELAHRSKNLLTVIQVMARRSAAPELSSIDFVESFVERLAGLAQSHDLLARDDWRGIDMLELMNSQVGHLDDKISGRITARGPDVILNAVAAQNFGMALHELATNAVKYGALSCQHGQVAVEWALSLEDPERPRLLLSWTESGGPMVREPVRRGFGRLVIETIAARALSGEVELIFDPAGVVCRIDAAADDAVLVANLPREAAEA